MKGHSFSLKLRHDSWQMGTKPGCCKIRMVVRMLQHLCLGVSWMSPPKIQLVHVDDGEVVQAGAGELDAVCESGVHSIEHRMGSEQVTWHEQRLVAAAMPQLSVWLGNKAKDSS